MPLLVGEGLVLAVLSDDTDHYPDRYGSAQKDHSGPD
jgi:hypothetical protein